MDETLNGRRPEETGVDIDELWRLYKRYAVLDEISCGVARNIARDPEVYNIFSLLDDLRFRVIREFLEYLETVK